VFCSSVIDIFSSIPIGILLVGHGDDLTDSKGKVVLVA
jgi:hypothetical protein